MKRQDLRSWSSKDISMTLNNLLQEEKVSARDRHSNRNFSYYINPSKEELRELADEANGVVRFIAWAPSANRHYFYVWDTQTALHHAVFDHASIPTENEAFYIYGYAHINKDGKLTFANRAIKNQWQWVKKYS